MTLLKRGSAVLAALLLVFQLATYPVRAMSVVLPAAGLALTVTAFLNLAGIYPFDTESSFGDWSEGGLADLIQQYNDTNPAIQLNGETLHAYLYGGTAILTHNAYVALRNFIQWLKDTFSLTDNQEGVSLAVGSSSYLPFYSSPPSFSQLTASNTWAVLPSPENKKYFASSSDVSLGAIVRYSSEQYYVFLGTTQANKQYYYNLYSSSGVGISSYRITGNYEGTTVYYSGYSNFPSSYMSDLQYSNFVVLDDVESFIEYVATGGVSSADVIVDTSTISVPPELPAEQEYIGLAISPGTVSGADTPATAMTPQAVERIIQQGVTERERPVVTPVEVEIGAGTDVDSETGAVTENPVVITPEAVAEEFVPAVSELIAPAATIAEYVSALQTKFPFCVPFDIARLFSAFVFEPRAPVISMSFHDPFTDSDYSIVIDLSPWDEVAAIARQLETMILVVGYSLAISRLLLTRDVLSGDLI